MILPGSTYYLTAATAATAASGKMSNHTAKVREDEEKGEQERTSS